MTIERRAVPMVSKAIGNLVIFPPTSYTWVKLLTLSEKGTGTREINGMYELFVEISLVERCAPGEI